MSFQQRRSFYGIMENFHFIPFNYETLMDIFGTASIYSVLPVQDDRKYIICKLNIMPKYYAIMRRTLSDFFIITEYFLLMIFFLDHVTLTLFIALYYRNFFPLFVVKEIYSLLFFKQPNIHLHDHYLLVRTR